jgi:hypothetical protein
MDNPNDLYKLKQEAAIFCIRNGKIYSQFIKVTENSGDEVHYSKQINQEISESAPSAAMEYSKEVSFVADREGQLLLLPSNANASRDSVIAGIPSLDDAIISSLTSAPLCDGPCLQDLMNPTRDSGICSDSYYLESQFLQIYRHIQYDSF